MGLPVIGSIMEGYRTSDTLKRQRDEMRVGVDLQNRATALAGRKAVGSYVSDVGASGVDLTLDEIGQANKEYALDIAIAEDYKKRQTQILDAEADYAIKQGWMDAAGEAIGLAAGSYQPSAPQQPKVSTQAPSTPQSTSGGLQPFSAFGGSVRQKRTGLN